MGKAVFFIRLHGCPVQCPWCDSAATWHPNHVPKNVERLTPQELFARKPASVDRVVITGGEPCIHDLSPLVLFLQQNKVHVALETCGAYELTGCVPDWITVSPKVRRLPIADLLFKAHELKIIVDTEKAVEFWDTTIKLLTKCSIDDLAGVTGMQVWLHPEWSKRNDQKILGKIVESVFAFPKTYRAGWQLHKCYGVDRMVEGSRKELVPLGGEGNEY